MDLSQFSRLIVFGGSFDPPHIGHVQLPALAMRAVEAEVVVYVPTARQPLKLDKDFQTLKIACGVAAGAKTSPEAVYQVTKAIFDNTKEWNSVHPLARQWNVKSATAVMSAPYHDGAIRYFKEKGVWSEQNQKDHEAWLKK